MIKQFPFFLFMLVTLYGASGFRPVSDDAHFLQLKDTFQSGKVSYTLALRVSYIKLGNVSERDVVMPAFPGGTDSLRMLIAEKLKAGKCFDVKDSLAGRIYFSVDTLGKTGAVSISKSLDPHLDLQLAELIGGLIFSPAYHSGSGKPSARVGCMDIEMRCVGRRKK